MNTAMIRERMAEVGWTRKRTDDTIRYLRKIEAIRRIPCNYKYRLMWRMVQ